MTLPKLRANADAAKVSAAQRATAHSVQDHPQESAQAEGEFPPLPEPNFVSTMTGLGYYGDDQMHAYLAADRKARGERPGFVLVPAYALRWLFGEEGSFECPPEHYFRGKPAPFWWRAVFRRMIALAARPTQQGD